MTIGKRMKERRKELKLSADELAARLGKDRSTIYRYEKSEIENVPLDLLESIAIALDTTPQYLVGWEVDREKKEKPTADEGDGVSKAKQELIDVIQNCPEDKVARLSAIIQLFLDGEH